MRRRIGTAVPIARERIDELNVKLLVPLAVLALPLQAQADVAGSAAAALTAETVAARNTALGELDAAKASDPLAAYTAGSVQFFVALEKLGERPASPRL